MFFAAKNGKTFHFCKFLCKKVKKTALISSSNRTGTNNILGAQVNIEGKKKGGRFFVGRGPAALTKLYYHYEKVSDRRDSNPRPSAWEANALPTEPLSQLALLQVQRYEK